MSYEIYRGVEELQDALPEPLIHTIFDAAQKVVGIPETLHFSIAIVDDVSIQALNRAYREKDSVTDVLSFRYDETSAEIVLCAKKIQEQAREFGHTDTIEAAFLLIHGILHTLGWDHERSEKEAAEQRKLEHDILRICGLDFAR